MNMRSQTQTKTTPKPSFTPVKTGLLQRKCACGNSASLTGKCTECENKRLTLQRRSTNKTEPDEVPPIVHEVLRESGQPLDTKTRGFMESCFGHDFSQVRVHTDGKAAESAQAVNALAYTVGQDIVFGSRHYAPETLASRRLLAHELAHTIQQNNSSMAGLSDSETLTIHSPSENIEREADRIAEIAVFQQQPHKTQPLGALISSRILTSLSQARVLQRQASGLAATPRVVTPRGSDPADCMTPLCDRISQQPPPSNDAQLQQRVNDWLNGALQCIRSGAAASNASHSAEIQANNESELQETANTILQDYNAMPPAGRARHRAEWRQWLGDDCRRRQREAQIEFHYNVVFENPRGSPPWGYAGAEWNNIEGALAALPAEATWMNPLLLRFRRAECHPTEVNPNTGQCMNVTNPVGGETDVRTGEIQIFNAGLGQQPYSRSRRLGLAATFQTLRHEVGHVVISQLPLSDRLKLFRDIMQWNDYPLSWISQPPQSGTPEQRRQARLDLCTELGFINASGVCDDSRLDLWVGSLQIGQTQVVGQRSYIKSRFYLNSILTTQIPQGSEFSYALTAQDEYFSELYTFAVSRPEWLHSVLPPEQIAWLKQFVFHTPATPNELARQAALAEPMRTQFIMRGSQLFTWEQLDLFLNMLVTQSQQQGTHLT